MKILLKHSVRSLGLAGDIVTVKPGYARNFLLPKGIAVPASEANVNLVESCKARRVVEEAKMKETYSAAAEAINSLELVLHMKANASNHLYGSVNAGEIVTQLNNRHINIEKDMVQLEDPIKELGNFEIAIQLDGQITATLKIEVRDEHGEIPVLEGNLDYDPRDDEEVDDEDEDEPRGSRYDAAEAEEKAKSAKEAEETADAETETA